MHTLASSDKPLSLALIRELAIFVSLRRSTTAFGLFVDFFSPKNGRRVARFTTERLAPQVLSVTTLMHVTRVKETLDELHWQ